MFLSIGSKLICCIHTEWLNAVTIEIPSNSTLPTCLLPIPDSMPAISDVVLNLAIRPYLPAFIVLALSIMVASLLKSVSNLRLQTSWYVILWYLLLAGISDAQQTPVSSELQVTQGFEKFAKPFLNKYCSECHNADQLESGIRVDHLTGAMEESTLKLWDAIRKQVAAQEMPPSDELQPSAQERTQFEDWLKAAMEMARSRDVPRNGIVRRLTVAQFRNTLRDLLKIDDNLTDILPPDAVSKDGFTNNAAVMQLSPLQIESYFQIAERALNIALVDEKSTPTIQHFRMDLGRGINSEPCPDSLILGANSLLLNNADFVVSEPKLEKPFAFHPFAMQRKFRFIEGYQGNDTVRDWRNYDSIYHAVFACMRGSEGYPKGRAYESVSEGLLLRPAIPSPEIFGESNTYGPHANFKISLRELPDHGRFRIKVLAAKYDDGLLLDQKSPIEESSGSEAIELNGGFHEPRQISITEEGIYQVDVQMTGSHEVHLVIGNRSFSSIRVQPGFVVVRLEKGEHQVSAHCAGSHPIEQISFRRLNPESPLSKQFQSFENRSPHIGVHLGLRRDCGSTLTQVGEPQKVASSELKEYIFEGAINNYPSPDVEKDNVNYLAGIREIGVRSEFTDGRDMPRLLIRSIEFEGPFYEQWPPESHRNIFRESESRDQPERYAHQILEDFASRAFRRPVSTDETQRLLSIWRDSFTSSRDFQQSIAETLVVVLTSPQFLFHIEQSQGPELEDLNDWELASKLSYFLWNTMPDDRLMQLALTGQLRHSLDSEVDRMIADTRFRQFTNEFASQWLSLDKFAVVEIDAKRFSKLTRDVKTELSREPARFIEHLIRNNLSAKNLVRSDFILANEVVASYYGCGDKLESGFEFVPIEHHTEHMGGVLTHAAVLAGLSDGRESNPVKRGAWFARRIIAEPPDDPPPNIPKLEDLSELTLRQRLEQHRNVRGCIKCHMGIDPWGLPFEQFCAGGLSKREAVDSQSELPDGKKVSDFNNFREYLLRDRLDQVAFSTMKHLASYALGRTLTYNEERQLRVQVGELRIHDYPMCDMIKAIVQSDLFLKK